MTNRSNTGIIRKYHGGGGAKSLAFEESFEVTIRMDRAIERAAAATTNVERIRWQREADKLGHKITTAARQAASEIHRAVVEEARRWLAAHDGMPNMAAFIKHVQALPACARRYRTADKPNVLTSNAVRHILKSRLGIIGEPGRRKKGT